MAHTRSVTVSIFIGCGSCYESDSEAGISHFIEHLCFKGTGKRPNAKDISEAIEGVGGIINAGTDKELTVYWCKVASRHLPLALDVLIDLIRNSRFDPVEIDRERQVIIEEINMSLDSPRQRVDMLMDELLWPGLPLGRDIAGRRELISQLTQKQIIEYFNNHYLPNNTVISIAGDIDEFQVQSIIRRELTNWEPSEKPARYPSVREQLTPGSSIEIKDNEQVQLCLGIPGISLFHPDRFSIDLLSSILGEGMSSRLFVEIRERRGLAYEIHSCTEHYLDSGAVVIRAGVDQGRVEDVVRAILDQLTLIKNDITESELNRVKELNKGRLVLALEDTRSVANWLGIQEILLEDILTVDEIMARIDAVTLDDLSRVASELIVNNRYNLAIVGPQIKEKPIISMLAG
jgi:predicted Zn-dependent peptidase